MKRAQSDFPKMNLLIADIKIPQGREPRRNVRALTESIEKIGLLNPITVRTIQLFEAGAEPRTGYRLVAGRNRLEAMKQLGHDEIPATIVSLEDLECQLAEIDENLVRLDIPLIDHADRLEHRQRIIEVLEDTPRHGGDRKSPEYKEKNQVANLAVRSAKDTAEKTGMSERAIQRLTQISNGVGHDLKTEIRDTPLAYNQDELVKLARIKDRAEQRTAARAYISGEADTITVPKKRGPTKTERQQAGEAFAELLMELRPEVWPRVCAYLKLDQATVTLSAFRKLQKATVA